MKCECERDGCGDVLMAVAATLWIVILWVRGSDLKDRVDRLEHPNYVELPEAAR